MSKPLLLKIWELNAVRGQRLTQQRVSGPLDMRVVVTPLARREIGTELELLSCGNPARNWFSASSVSQLVNDASSGWRYGWRFGRFRTTAPDLTAV
jgi:hypothetical protein